MDTRIETPHIQPPVRSYHFDELRAAWLHTAAASLPLVIYHDEIDAGQQAVSNRHGDFFSLYFVRRGRGTHWIEGVPYGVARGDVYAMGLGMTHWFADCEDLATDTLHFAPVIFDAVTRDALAEMPGFQSLFVEEPLRRASSQGATGYGEGGRWLHLTPDAYAPVAEMLGELRREWAAGTPDGTLLVRGLFPRLLVHLARRYAASYVEPRSGPRISQEATQEATVAAAVRYLDAHFAEPVSDAPADAPDFPHRDAIEQPSFACGGHRREIAHTVEQREFLADVVGQLGQGFGWTDADADRQRGPLQNPGADILAHDGGRGPQARHAGQVEEGFIDRVHLDVRAVGAQNRHDAVRHVTV